MFAKVDGLRTELLKAIELAVKPGYVYTYPPKRAFRSLSADFSHVQAWDDQGGSVNIYVHVPFCEVRCRFCNLFTVPLASSKRDLTDVYTDALVDEIRKYGRLVGERRVESIYFGGGTPTYLRPEQFRRIFEQLYASFGDIPDEVEKSVEAYPDDADAGKLEALRALGVNRVSFGIQTFDPDELRLTGRPYPAELGREVLQRVNEIGFADFNADLIYGLPHQTIESWERNLHSLGELRPPTITIYPLMVRPATAFGRQKERSKVDFVPDRTKFEWYELARRILSAYGYKQETTVRFVLPGKGGYRQQAKEFSGTPTLGLGPGARSSAPSVHYSTGYAVAYKPTLDIIKSYISRIQAGQTAATMGFYLDEDEKLRRYVVQALQLPGGIEESVFEAMYGASLYDVFGTELQTLELEGCISRVAHRGIALTDKGRKYSDICVRLFFSQRVRELEQEYVAV